jgi:hypothetical protein
MHTDQVGKLEGTILQFSRDSYNFSELLSSLVGRESWQGNVADYFWDQLTAVSKKLHLSAEELTKLSLALGREREQWEDVDNQGVFRLKNSAAPQRPAGEYSWWFQGRLVVEGVGNLIEDYKFNKDYIRFKQWWETQSIDERKVYLQNLLNRKADQLGWPRMLIVADDLVDPTTGDAKGLNMDEILIIDIDNLKSDDPWRVMELMFHENRHQFQREAVSNYLDSGVIPDGMSKREIQKWADEMENYVSGYDDFESYYNQAIEKDARKWGDDIMKDVLDEMSEDPWLNGGSGGGGW